MLVELRTALRDATDPYGHRQNRLFGMHAERWLESPVGADVSVIDGRWRDERWREVCALFSANACRAKARTA